MSRKIRIGVLGCAAIAKKSVIPAIKSLPEHFELAGIASRTFEKAELLADSFQTTAYESYSLMLDQGKLDAVYIPLPNALHLEWVTYALNRGLHVLVEKSLACSAKDVELMCQTAKKRNLALIENFQFRFHKQLSTIKEIVSADEIGELRCVSASFGFPPFPDSDNIRYQRSLGGGALLDAGAYTIKISQEFLGQELVVSSACLSSCNEGVDLWGGGFIQQSKGNLFSQIAFGFDNHYLCDLTLWGSKGKLKANRIFTAPPDFHPNIIIETSKGEKNIKLSPNNHFIEMLLHFYRVIKNPILGELELSQNICQAQLIDQFRTIANG